MRKFLSTVFASVAFFSLTIYANSAWDWNYFFSTGDMPKNICSEKIDVVGVLDLSPNLGETDTIDSIKKAKDTVYKMFANKGPVKKDDSNLSISDRITKDIEDTQKRINDDIKNTQKRINNSFKFDKEQKKVCKTKIIAVITTIEVPVSGDN